MYTFTVYLASLSMARRILFPYTFPMT